MVTVPGGMSGEGAPGGPAGSPAPGSSDPSGDLRFARLLAVLGVAVLGAALFLIALPTVVGGPPLVYLIAYGTATLFGPAGFTLLARAWRIRNRAVHGASVPAGQRAALRVLGAALIAVGLFLIFSDFGVSGTISRVLNFVWGMTLGMYGVRFVLRSFLADRE